MDSASNIPNQTPSSNSASNSASHSAALGAKRVPCTTDEISKLIGENNVVLFARGNRQEPRCGFTARAIDFLDSMNIEFLCLDVLADRSIMPAVITLFGRSNFPSVAINNELVDDFDKLRDLVCSIQQVANG